jgi:error-prone DNA polymerase
LFPDRRQALWTVKGLFDAPLLKGLRRPSDAERPPIPAPTELDELHEDFRRVGLSVTRNPIAMMRARLDDEGVLRAEAVIERPAGARVKVSGLVAHRQRPGTAQGIIFMTLEDETGLLNLVVKPDLFERQRKVILGENLVTVVASVQKDGDSMSLLCHRFDALRLDGEKVLDARSRDFH